MILCKFKDYLQLFPIRKPPNPLFIKPKNNKFRNNAHNKMVLNQYQNQIFNMLNKSDYADEISKEEDLMGDLAIDLK